VYTQPQWLIEGDACTEAAGDRWTETGNFQGYGPFTLKEWLHENSLSVVRDPFWPGTPAVPSPKVDEIVWTMLDQVPAFANYEADLLDMVLVPLSDIDRVKAAPEYGDELKIDANLASYYYGFHIKAPVVDDVRVRRALSMAVDRQDLVDNVTKGAEEPAQWFCRPGAAGCPNLEKYPDLGVKFDSEQAKALLSEYLAEKGLAPGQPDITLAIASDSRHQRIAEAIQAMWKKHLDLDVKIMAQESKTYWVTVIDPVETPQLWRNGWNADYPDANKFIFESFAYGLSRNPVGGGGTNWGKYEPFEEAIAKAAMETDPAIRMDLYAQAEQILNWDQCVMIPIYWDSQVAVTKPYVQRTYSKIKGFEHHEKWDIVK
jgi:oligopeptide transport system substrate-binding protein